MPFSFRVAFATVGDASFELIAPLEGKSIYMDFLKTHGEGMHHTCIAYATREALREAKAEMVARAAPWCRAQTWANSASSATSRYRSSAR